MHRGRGGEWSAEGSQMYDARGRGNEEPGGGLDSRGQGMPRRRRGLVLSRARWGRGWPVKSGMASLCIRNRLLTPRANMHPSPCQPQQLSCVLHGTEVVGGDEAVDSKI